MDKAFNGAQRIKVLGFEIIRLMGKGKTETISKIEEEIGKGTVVRYLSEKYHDDMFNEFNDKCPYNIDDWEKEFSKYYGCIRDYYGISDENDGLLVMMALVLDLAEKV